MAIVNIKRGDTARRLSDTLILNNSAIDLTGGAVVLVWRQDGVVSRKTATIDDAVAGEVSYTLDTADVDTSGMAFLEWEVTLNTGDIITVPTNGYISLAILDDLG